MIFHHGRFFVWLKTQSIAKRSRNKNRVTFGIDFLSCVSILFSSKNSFWLLGCFLLQCRTAFTVVPITPFHTNMQFNIPLLKIFIGLERLELFTFRGAQASTHTSMPWIFPNVRFHYLFPFPIIHHYIFPCDSVLENGWRGMNFFCYFCS